MEPDPPGGPVWWLRSPRELVVLLIAATLLGRLVLAYLLGLGVDESYAVAVSRPFSLSYFDHAPLAFWMPGIMGALTGSSSALVVRLPFILLFAGTTWMMYRLGARLFGERAGAIAALLLNLIPVLSVSAGGWVLPDGPLLFWMLATALCLERVLIPPRRSNDAPSNPTLWWIAAGACAGMAMLSKYHGVFLLAGTALFLLTRRDARHWLRHPAPYLAVAIAALVCSPVLLWNAQHDWISLRFQGNRGAAHHGIHFLSFFQNIAGQLGYLLPWIGIPLAWVLGRALAGGARSLVSERSSRRIGSDGVASDDDRAAAARWLLACLAIGPIAAFTLITLGGDRGLPHWQAPGWLMAIPLLAERVDAALTRGSARARRFTEWWLSVSLIAFVALMIAVATQARTGWMERVGGTRLADVDPTIEMVDWSELGAVITRAQGASSGASDPRPGRVFVAATNWLDAGKVAFALKGRADVVCLCAEPHHFMFVGDSRAYLSRDAIIVVRKAARPRTELPLVQYFRSVTPMGTTVVRRGGLPAVELELYRGEELIADVPSRAP